MKCTKKPCQGELVINAKDVYEVADATVLMLGKCDTCFTMHEFEFTDPRLVQTYEQPLELKSVLGSPDERHDYFKCSNGGDSYILVAKKGPWVSEERLKALGLTIIDRGDDTYRLPAYRLYELR